MLPNKQKTSIKSSANFRDQATSGATSLAEELKIKANRGKTTVKFVDSVSTLVQNIKTQEPEANERDESIDLSEEDNKDG